MKNLKVRRPASLEVAAILVKEGLQQVPIDVKYPGFTIGPQFVVGYGLDFAQKLRNLPYIGVMEDDA
jgi:hypoxanthine phosphoribosyltransferase